MTRVALPTSVFDLSPPLYYHSDVYIHVNKSRLVSFASSKTIFEHSIHNVHITQLALRPTALITTSNASRTVTPRHIIPLHTKQLFRHHTLSERKGLRTQLHHHPAPSPRLPHLRQRNYPAQPSIITLRLQRKPLRRRRSTEAEPVCKTVLLSWTRRARSEASSLGR